MTKKEADKFLSRIIMYKMAKEWKYNLGYHNVVRPVFIDDHEYIDGHYEFIGSNIYDGKLRIHEKDLLNKKKCVEILTRGDTFRLLLQAKEEGEEIIDND